MGGDTVTGLAEAFSSKNVLGAGESTLIVTSYTINDGDGGNDYAVTTQSAAGTITPAPLTIIAATSDSKAYNGTTASTATPTYTGLITVGGDTITGLAEAFSSKNVLGTGDSTLIVTSYTINDGDGGNDYAITTQSAAGTITPAPLTIIASSDSKVYDGTTSATPTPTYTGLITVGGDTITGLAEAFSSKNVLGAGDSTLNVTSYTVNDGDDGEDYTVTLRHATGTITPAPLTITAATDSKPYDGTTASSLTPTYSGLMTAGGDTLTGLAQAFSSKNVLGAGDSTLVVTSYTVNDGDGGNDYSVTTQSAAGTITPASLVINATTDSKAYDGTTASTATPTVTGLITVGGDTITGLAEAFSSKNVLGAGDSTLIVTGYTINDGDGGNDYSVTTQSAAGTITPTALMITATTESKVYDGTTSATATPTVMGLITVGGDTVTGLAEAFSSKHVLGADDSTLSVTSYTINDGDGGNDYTVTTQSATGTITPAPLIISANDQTMGAGDAVPRLTASYQGLVGSDTPASLTTPVVLATSATSSSPAGVYPITASGASSPDYAISYRAGTLTISPTTVTLTASNSCGRLWTIRHLHRHGEHRRHAERRGRVLRSEHSVGHGSARRIRHCHVHDDRAVDGLSCDHGNLSRDHQHRDRAVEPCLCLGRPDRHQGGRGPASGLQEEKTDVSRPDGGDRAVDPRWWRSNWRGDVRAVEEVQKEGKDDHARPGGPQRRRGDLDAQGQQGEGSGDHGCLQRRRQRHGQLADHGQDQLDGQRQRPSRLSRGFALSKSRKTVKGTGSIRRYPLIGRLTTVGSA